MMIVALQVTQNDATCMTAISFLQANLGNNRPRDLFYTAEDRRRVLQLAFHSYTCDDFRGQDCATSKGSMFSAVVATGKH